MAFLWRERPDVIHACDLDTLPPAVFIKLTKKTKLCYTIFDLYGRVYGGPIPLMIRKAVTWAEKVGIGFVDTLFLPSEGRAFHEELGGARIRRVVYIYNTPEDRPDMKLKPKSTPETCIFYAGWIDSFRGVKHMIDAIADLNDVRFVLAGRELEKGTIEYGVAKLSRFEYLGWIPYEEVIKRSIAADILFAFYDPESYYGKYATPNKLFEAMMCGKPIIVSEGAPMSQIVAEENCGIVVPYGDFNAIKDAVLRLKSDPDFSRMLGQNGRKAYDRCYSWKVMEKRLVDAYEEIAPKGGTGALGSSEYDVPE